jgi:hypothetical protein
MGRKERKEVLYALGTISNGISSFGHVRYCNYLGT